MVKVNKSLLLSSRDRMLRRSPNRNIFIWIMGFSLCVAALFGNIFELLPQVTYQQQQQHQQDGDFINDVPSAATDDGGRRVLITSAPAATATTTLNNRNKDKHNDHDVVRNSWLGDYFHFHQTSLEYNSTSHSYNVREDSSDDDNNNNTKYLIYHCGGNCGGVGDRLKGIFSALYLSICTNRVLLVDAKHPDDLANYLEPQSIKWNATPPKGYYNNNKFFAFIDMMDQPYHRMLQDPYQMLIDEPHIANAKIIKLHINTWRPIQFAESKCIQQLQQSKSNTNTHLDLSQIYRYFFESLFDWSTNVENRVKEYRLMAGMKQQQQQQQPNDDRTAAAQKQQQQQQQQKVEPLPFVGVHIRTGPTTAGFKDPPRHVNQEGSFYDCAKKYQTRLKDICKNAAADDNPDIFVASDNKESKQKVQKMDDYSTADNNNGNGSTTTTTVKFVDVDIVHVDKGGTRLVGNLKQLDIWSEMKMLSDSTCLVYSRSGFSETAAWIKNDGCSIRFDDCNTNETLFEETLQKVKC